ncbi:hypothetical protein NDU88_002420 [Pleurodeles waltl]|uniref:Uncharacterized protein n=1 Tax=Pleurodeles waltl TaxID=8319 RepID=A0AAV7VDS0_PLEWA|nr:hypothetical protein NDU88_002420 [Pleurodeles waltl]
MGMAIAGFKHCVTGLKQCVVIVEDRLNTVPEHDQELLFLHSKIIDLEDKCHRDNVCLFGLLKCLEGTDMRGFLRYTLPTITGLNFDFPLEFQRGQCVSQAHLYHLSQSHPIIAYFLKPEPARQVLTAARSHGPNTYEGHEICMAADFFRETNDRHNAFLSL